MINDNHIMQRIIGNAASHIFYDCLKQRSTPVLSKIKPMGTSMSLSCITGLLPGGTQER